jgi:hypothetical protein
LVVVWVAVVDDKSCCCPGRRVGVGLRGVSVRLVAGGVRCESLDVGELRTERGRKKRIQFINDE